MRAPPPPERYFESANSPHLVHIERPLRRFWRARPPWGLLKSLLKTRFWSGKGSWTRACCAWIGLPVSAASPPSHSCVIAACFFIWGGSGVARGCAMRGGVVYPPPLEGGGRSPRRVLGAMGGISVAADFRRGGFYMWLPSSSRPASSGKTVMLTSAGFSGLLSRAPRWRHFVHPSCGSTAPFFVIKACFQCPLVPIHGQIEAGRRQSLRVISNCAVLSTPPFGGLFRALLALLSRRWRVARVFFTPFLIRAYKC